MSLPGLPCTGTYEILSVPKAGKATSVNYLIPPPQSQIVRLGLQDKVWEVTEESEDVYNFAVKSLYPYSGEQDNKVIATKEKPEKLLWRVGPATSGNYFGLIITPKGDYEKGWTVADPSNPESEIALEKIDYSPLTIYPPIIKNPYQLFQFKKV